MCLFEWQGLGLMQHNGVYSPSPTMRPYYQKMTYRLIRFTTLHGSLANNGAFIAEDKQSIPHHTYQRCILLMPPALPKRPYNSEKRYLHAAFLVIQACVCNHSQLEPIPYEHAVKESGDCLSLSVKPIQN